MTPTTLSEESRPAEKATFSCSPALRSRDLFGGELAGYRAAERPSRRQSCRFPPHAPPLSRYSYLPPLESGSALRSYPSSCRSVCTDAEASAARVLLPSWAVGFGYLAAREKRASARSAPSRAAACQVVAGTRARWGSSFAGPTSAPAPDREDQSRSMAFSARGRCRSVCSGSARTSPRSAWPRSARLAAYWRRSGARAAARRRRARAKAESRRGRRRGGRRGRGGTRPARPPGASLCWSRRRRARPRRWARARLCGQSSSPRWRAGACPGPRAAARLSRPGKLCRPRPARTCPGGARPRP